MGRPSPKVLLKHTNKQYQEEFVLEAVGIYTVFYDGQPINLRRGSCLHDEFVKYPRVSFSNSGHAKLLAAKLNARYDTTLFQAVLLSVGVPI